MTEAAVADDRKYCTESECPLEAAHDRLIEASYFLHQMVNTYHNPAEFRYNGNAFLSALKSTTEMLRMDLERAGKAQWLKENKSQISNDHVLSKFMVGRNIVLHQRPLLQGSSIQAGIFRGYKLKLVILADLQNDRTTRDLLQNSLVPTYTGFLIDAEHSAIGEQLGIRRKYHVAELDESNDVLTASFMAFGRMTQFTGKAHEAIGKTVTGISEEEIKEWNPVAEVSLMLEGDLDPESYIRWGWQE